jgi:hypothetical protein
MFKTINGFTKAKMIEMINNRMLDHRAVSRSPNGEVIGCAYRDPKNGNRCAIGCFIPEGHESEKFGNGVASLLVHYPELKNLMPIQTMGLSNMQRVHDRCEIGNPKLEVVQWIEANVQD